MLVYIKSSSVTKLPEGIRRRIDLLNRRLRANAITLEDYSREASLLKRKVDSRKWEYVSNLLMVSL